MTLLALPSPSGDEGAIAEWLQNEARRVAPGAALTRLGDNLLVVRGNPRAAIFAHTDTTGFTLGYRDALLPIGEPSPHDEEPVRAVVPFPDGTHARGRLRVDEPGEEETYRLENPDAPALPGTRWVYDRPATRDNGTLTAPYLDNRAGVWCALRALERSPNVAVAFSTGEEQHGHGARVCAHWLYANLQITQTLIADMTWTSDDIRCGDGAVISLRDVFCPRQSYLHQVITLADRSGIPYQQEIQSEGSSDGGHLMRTPYPIDWVFVGAPQENPHTSKERVALSDLDHLTDLLVYLADRL